MRITVDSVEVRILVRILYVIYTSSFLRRRGFEILIVDPHRRKEKKLQE